MPSFIAIKGKLQFFGVVRSIKSSPSRTLIFFALLLPLITNPQAAQAQGTSVAVNWANSNPSLVVGASSVSQTVGGVMIIAQGYVVEFNGSSSIIYGPFPTSGPKFGQTNVTIPIFSPKSSGLANQPGLGLMAEPVNGLNISGLDFDSSQGRPGIDNFPFLQDNPNIPGTPLPQLQFVLFSFSSPVDVSAVTVGLVSNFKYNFWVAGGNSAPSVGADLVSAFSGYSVVNLIQPYGVPLTRAVDFKSVSYLAVGALVPAAVGTVGPFMSNNENDQFYVTDLQLATSSVTSAQLGKELGDNTGKTGTLVTTCSPGAGDPIDIPSGNMFYAVADCATAGQNPLRFTRYYNSRAGTDTFAASLGRNWRSSFDRYLKIASSTSVSAERADGKLLTFTLNGSTWTPDTDVDLKLVQAGSTWTVTDPDDSVEIYAAISGTEAILTSITARNGYMQTLQYNSSNQLQSVTDSFNRSLNFTYLNGLLNTMTTPDNLVLAFGYDSPLSGANRLLSVAYSTSPQTSQTYLYENSGLPFALTGIVDEDSNRFATWTYDSLGRGLTTQHGSGADLMTIVYNDSDGSRTVTNALGVTDTYSVTTLQGVPKVTQISRGTTSTTAAAVELATYDSNGYIASRADWNGNQTVYVNDARGEPTSITAAAGTPQARTMAITYDTMFHLPVKIVEPGITTDLVYDASGNLLTRTLTDTTTTTVPYATAGTKRAWTFTWANSLLASVKGPRTDVDATTGYSYDSSGALTQITNALSQSVQTTQHTPGGLPQTILDSNGVTAQLTYDVRQRLTSRSINTAAGALTTSYVYDSAGNLLSTTLPDGSVLTNAYDSAHRLTKVTDALGNYTSYTLDALGDRTQVTVFRIDGTLTWQRSGTFDALGRELVDTTGAGQTTTRTFDPNGNVLTVKDGLNHTTANTYDALNRLSTSTDANGGLTTPAYDFHDRIVSVTDANNNSTAYVRDGFGDVIQQTSPDSGISVFHYDGDADLTSKTDALGIVTNQTFDALDRRLTTTYPANTAENVVYTYDQTGTGFTFGIGRLTSVADAAGSLTRTYDERGNLASEKRVNGSTVLTTGYTYDGANRVASMTYPDGTLVTYQFNGAGYLAKVSAKPAGSSTTTTIAMLNHQPFGPINAATYGNGIAETWAFDTAYRPTNITDVLTGANIQNSTYAYDNASNVTSIADALNAANSQTLGYDAINRLTSAVSGTGGYGTYSWTYDKVGNRLTQVQGSATTTYGYTPGTNRLATITPGTAMATLGAGQTLSARNFPNAIPATTRMIQPSIPGERPSPMLTSILGWPMLFVGFAGVLRFRRRLLSDGWLAIVVCGLLTGGATLLIGCGGGSKHTPPVSPASTPTFSPAGGTFTAAQAVTISDSTAGATIYYTTDGTPPTTASTKYTGPITVSSSETIKAIAVASGYTNSAVATANYTIDIPTAATPTFSPAGGTFTAAQVVTISDSTAGATIYFTTDGTTPSTSSTQYSSPITVSTSETIEAIAAASGFTNSAVATADYAINLPTVVTVTTNANGNITSIPPANSTAYATFAYNNANRLASVTGSPLAATFVYDWAGQRFSKTNNGSTPTIYSYMQDGTLISENNNGVVTDYIYADGRPIAILQPSATPSANQVNYVLADHLETPQLVSNSSGITVWSTSYQPFGTTGLISASINQNLRFPGQYADVEDGFSYNLNRDYMPNLGRYLESDPIGLGGGLNTYAYGKGDPYKNTDPTGTQSPWEDQNLPKNGTVPQQLGSSNGGQTPNREAGTEDRKNFPAVNLSSRPEPFATLQACIDAEGGGPGAPWLRRLFVWTACLLPPPPEPPAGCGGDLRG